MTLLQKRTLERRERRFQIHEETRDRLRKALSQLAPGRSVILFGSITRPGVFNARSDIDLALEEEWPGLNSWQLTSRLMSALDRPVDVVILTECRFREKIEREGERWTL